MAKKKKKYIIERVKWLEPIVDKMWEEENMKDRDMTKEIAALFDKSTPVARLEAEHFTKPLQIVCKYCQSKDIMKIGTRNGVQYYICRKCKRRFTAKDTPFGMRTPIEQIGASLNMFYDGLSLSDISRHLDETYNNPVDPSTVYRWLIRYTNKAIDELEKLKPIVSDTWVVDETVVKVGGRNVWFLDIIDEDTRFLLASYLSRHRGILDVATVMHRAWKRTDNAPRFIISDSWGTYPDGIERVFGAYSKHIQAKGITHEINTNLIERFHGTLKDRTKVLRGFKTLESAELILDGFLIHYNFFRPHMSLRDKTPAQVAKIQSPFRNWTELVRKVGHV